MPGIGVAIPAFNRADLIGETLGSVLAQTLPPAQIVVVDDGSTDNTRQVVEAYAGRGVEYVFQPNAGLSAARNTGFASLRPDLAAVLFLDSDDRLVPDALARLSDALNSSPDTALAYGRPCLIDPVGLPLSQGWEFEDATGDVYNTLLPRNFICTAGLVLLRRESLVQAGAWDCDLPATEDWDMWLRIAAGGGRFARATGGPVLEYRIHPGNKSKDLRATHEMELRIYDKQIRAHANDPARVALITGWRDKKSALLARAEATGAEGQDAFVSPRHRLLRSLLGGAGLAGVYRRLPLRLRLQARALLGVDRWA